MSPWPEEMGACSPVSSSQLGSPDRVIQQRVSQSQRGQEESNWEIFCSEHSDSKTTLPWCCHGCWTPQFISATAGDPCKARGGN